jgi:sigma-B regulation protein RsbU (phosphoserine phosphatase)
VKSTAAPAATSRRPARSAPFAASPGARARAPQVAEVPPAAFCEQELARLRSLAQEHQQALDSVAQLQRRLCAPPLMRRSRLDVACDVFPVQRVSGDFVKLMDAGGSILLALGDISGKGLQAGFWFTHLYGLVRSFAPEFARPADALAAINRMVCALRPDAPLAALFLARLNPLTGEFQYCNAGLPAPIVLRGDGSEESLSAGGVMLGALPEARFDCGTARLASGDALLVYSDGLVECANSQGEEFGSAGLLASARMVNAGSAHNMLYSVLGAALDFAGPQPRSDDFSLIVARYSDARPGA